GGKGMYLRPAFLKVSGGDDVPAAFAVGKHQMIARLRSYRAGVDILSSGYRSEIEPDHGTECQLQRGATVDRSTAAAFARLAIHGAPPTVGRSATHSSFLCCDESYFGQELIEELAYPFSIGDSSTALSRQQTTAGHGVTLL